MSSYQTALTISTVIKNIDAKTYITFKRTSKTLLRKIGFFESFMGRGLSAVLD